MSYTDILIISLTAMTVIITLLLSIILVKLIKLIKNVENMVTTTKTVAGNVSRAFGTVASFGSVFSPMMGLTKHFFKKNKKKS